RHPTPTPFPSTTLFRSHTYMTAARPSPDTNVAGLSTTPAWLSPTTSLLTSSLEVEKPTCSTYVLERAASFRQAFSSSLRVGLARSEEHTSELQSRENLV